MGWSFSVTLAHPDGALGKAKQALLRAFKKAMGYVPARDGQEPEAAVTLYRAGGWIAMVSEELDFSADIDQGEPQLQRLSAALEMPLIHFSNYDSDALLEAVTDGRHTHFACCGDPDTLAGFGMPVGPGDLSLLDKMLTDETSRARLREILSSRPVFSEDIVAQLSSLLAFPKGLAPLSPGAKPWAVLNLVKAAPKERVSRLLPADMPPALDAASTSHINGEFVVLDAACGGGEGRGLRVTILPENYDGADWEIPVVTFLPPGEQIPDRFRHAAFVVPRCKTIDPDGRAGWVAECPDLPLHRGMNPEYARMHPLKAQRYHGDHGALIYLAFFKKDPDLPDPAARVTRFILTPMENPSGSVSSQLILYPFEAQYCEGEIVNDWWMGPYSPFSHK